MSKKKTTEQVVPLETQKRNALKYLSTNGFPKQISDRISKLINEAQDEAALRSAQDEILDAQLSEIKRKLLPPESSPFDPDSREWKRGDRMLNMLHGIYEFDPCVKPAQRQWWHEQAVCFVVGHARFYAQFFDEVIVL